MTFDDLHERICDALRGNRLPMVDFGNISGGWNEENHPRENDKVKLSVFIRG